MERVHTQQASQSVPVETVRAVAERTGIEETELPPLGKVIDTDALQALFTHGSDGTSSSFLTVQFDYYGCTVTVDENRTITLE